MKIIGNIIWLIFGGLETGIEYFVSSIGMMITIIGIPFGIASLRIGLLLCITIIGIPFGKKQFHLAGLALAPFGKQVIPA